MIGFEEPISEFMGGALVPPGVDSDYRDYREYIDDGENDDDFDY